MSKPLHVWARWQKMFSNVDRLKDGVSTHIHMLSGS